MEQRCHLSMVWLTWLGLPLVAVVTWFRVGLLPGAIVLAVGIVAQVLYLRWFPYMSKWMGYGSVADTPAPPGPVSAPRLHVTLYTANVCPFCPIVKRRVAELQQQGTFEVREVDVTFKPDIIREKGIRSVPVLEAGGRMLVGNATSAQIAAFLSAART